jgi:hypothetical protein
MTYIRSFLLTYPVPRKLAFEKSAEACWIVSDLRFWGPWEGNAVYMEMTMI